MLKPHQLHHARVKHNLHLVLVLSAAEHQVARLQISMDNGVGLPASRGTKEKKECVKRQT